MRKQTRSSDQLTSFASGDRSGFRLPLAEMNAEFNSSVRLHSNFGIRLQQLIKGDDRLYDGYSLDCADRKKTPGHLEDAFLMPVRILRIRFAACTRENDARAVPVRFSAQVKPGRPCARRGAGD